MRKRKNNNSADTFFASISDLMTGLLFIFILLFLKEYLSSNKNEYKKILNEYSKMIKENKIMKEKKEKLEEKIEKLTKENNKYKKQDRKIEEIYQKIEKKLKESIKNNPYVKIDTVNQELILDNSVLFDSGEWQLKEKGKDALRKVLPTFFSTFLDDKEIISYLEQLVIEGHTDDTGPGDQQENYLYNLNLSQKRAFEVVNFIYSDDKILNLLKGERLKNLKVYLSSNGKSNSNLIYKKGTTEIDREKSRRVTIKYKLDIQKIRGLSERK